MLLSDEDKKSENGQKMFERSVDRMKLVTRQYSRKQTRWIRNRFLNKDRPSPPVYAVSSNEPKNWDTDCLEPAVKVKLFNLMLSSLDFMYLLVNSKSKAKLRFRDLNH